MDENTLREGLQEAGLSQYEAEAYLTVLERGTAPAVTIAEQSDVPKTRVYDVLRDLEDEGYVETFEGESLSVRARDPSDVLEHFERRAERLATTAEEIKDRWERPELDDHEITVLNRFDSVIEQFEIAAVDATNRMQVAASPDQLEAIRPALADAIDRDVFVKLSLMTDLDDVHEVDDIEFADIATEARHRTLPAPFTASVDRTRTYFASMSAPTDEYGIIIDDFSLTYVFNWYFQSALWETWDPVYVSDSTKQVYVDVREFIRDLAPLITDGVTIPVTVRGFDTETRENVTLSGDIVEIISPGSPDQDGSVTLAQLARQATLVLEADDREFGIGGRGARLEDIEATRIVIRDSEAIAEN
jgi:sugar-specific transcriptional regulator TrmB